MTTGRINQVTFSSARANDSRATPRICSTLASTWSCAHKPQTRPKNGRLRPTATTTEEMRHLRLPLLGTIKHQSGQVGRISNSTCPNLCTSPRRSSNAAEGVAPSRAEKRRRCVPQAIYSLPSSLDAKRDQCCTQSTRGIHIHALWRGQEHAVRDLSRRGCPAGNQTSTHHLASTKRRKQPCGSVGRWQTTKGWRVNVKPPDCLPLRNVVEGN